MTRLRILVVFLAVVGAACGDSNDDSADGASETTMQPNDTAPAGADKMGMQDTATCAPQGAALTITAEGTAFDAACLAAPAGQDFTIVMDNKDSVPHSLAILASHDTEDVLFRGDIFQGPKSTTYQVPALKAGTYAFHCEVHPSNMKGTFVVA